MEDPVSVPGGGALPDETMDVFRFRRKGRPLAPGDGAMPVRMVHVDQAMAPFARSEALKRPVRIPAHHPTVGVALVLALPGGDDERAVGKLSFDRDNRSCGRETIVSPQVVPHLVVRDLLPAIPSLAERGGGSRVVGGREDDLVVLPTASHPLEKLVVTHRSEAGLQVS